MIRRLSLAWPDAPAGGSRRVRLLAVSDEAERALEFEPNREQLGQLDGILGCGDLEPAYLGFLADAFCVPLLYVRGNHDRGANWQAASAQLPGALDARVEPLAGINVAGLSWPSDAHGRAIRDEAAAWRQALSLYLHARGRRPRIVASHVPPRGLGDAPADDYHRGFAAYRWLCRRLKPLLWLHGHTSPAMADRWRVDWGATTLVNVTGAVLIEITAGAAGTANIEP
jgi:Icc-related predicted phosphoesterase